MVAVMEAKESPYAIAKEVLQVGVTESRDAHRTSDTYERNSGLYALYCSRLKVLSSFKTRSTWYSEPVLSYGFHDITE